MCRSLNILLMCCERRWLMLKKCPSSEKTWKCTGKTQQCNWGRKGGKKEKKRQSFKWASWKCVACCWKEIFSRLRIESCELFMCVEKGRAPLKMFGCWFPWFNITQLKLFPDPTALPLPRPVEWLMALCGWCILNTCTSLEFCIRKCHVRCAGCCLHGDHTRKPPPFNNLERKEPRLWIYRGMSRFFFLSNFHIIHFEKMPLAALLRQLCNSQLKA